MHRLKDARYIVVAVFFTFEHLDSTTWSSILTVSQSLPSRHNETDRRQSRANVDKVETCLILIANYCFWKRGNHWNKKSIAIFVDVVVVVVVVIIVVIIIIVIIIVIIVAIIAVVFASSLSLPVSAVTDDGCRGGQRRLLPQLSWRCLARSLVGGPLVS